MQRPGTAVHLQEVLHREPMDGSPALGIPPCAHELRAVRWTRSGFKEECPRSRECRVQATQADRQDIFLRKRPNVRKKVKFRSVFSAPCAALCPRAQGGIRVNFFQRSALCPKTG